MKLVICEKNIAARRIAYILSGGKSNSTRLGKTPVYEFTKDGETWKIVGLRGHIINLDFPAGFNQWNKISPIELIEVDPCKKISEKSIAASLKSLVNKNPFLIVATDYDREGELIGVEVIDLLKNYNKEINQIKRGFVAPNKECKWRKTKRKREIGRRKRKKKCGWNKENVERNNEKEDLVSLL